MSRSPRWNTCSSSARKSAIPWWMPRSDWCSTWSSRHENAALASAGAGRGGGRCDLPGRIQRGAAGRNQAGARQRAANARAGAAAAACAGAAGRTGAAGPAGCQGGRRDKGRQCVQRDFLVRPASAALTAPATQAHATAPAYRAADAIQLSGSLCGRWKAGDSAGEERADLHRLGRRGARKHVSGRTFDARVAGDDLSAAQHQADDRHGGDMRRSNAWHGGRIAWIALLAVLVAGCAGHELHRDGLTLMQQGRDEEGLAKLSEATRAAPRNLTYRADLLRNREHTVNRLLDAASSERAGDHPDVAQAIYMRILAIDPDNSRARLGLEALEMDKRHDAALDEVETRLKRGDLDAARAALKPVLLENPKTGKALLMQWQIEQHEAKQRLAEPALKAKFPSPVTLQFRDANRTRVFEALSRNSGINVLLNKDVKSDLKVSVFVRDVSVEDTIDLILLQNQLEKKVISDNTVFIYPSTPAKLKDYQDLKVRSFHLTNADPKQMLTMIKTLLKTKDIFVHEKTNSLVMRDTPEAIRLAEKMIADQDIADPEVMLEVEVLEIARSRLSEIGIKFPNQLNFTPLGGLATAAGATGTNATTVAQLTINGLRGLNERNIGVSPLPTVTLNALLQDGDTNVLSSPRIRVRNREKAKIMIGERVPVITNAVTPVSTGTPVVTGSVQYLDVGLKLEVEPDIHLDAEVVIKVGLDVSSIIKEVPNEQSGTLAYEVGTRNATTVLRLKDGETQVLAGLINDEDRKTASKVPGLGQIPVLGHLFSSHKKDGKKTEIVLAITPRIVGSARLHDAGEVEYWSGTVVFNDSV